MNPSDLQTCLQDLPLGEVRFFECTSSSNDEAARWVESGCPDLALVVAEEQTAGRGRGGRKWHTPAGAALAFSLVLQSEALKKQLLTYHNTARLNGLGALAVCEALQGPYGLTAEIKWPNDVLVGGMKVAGVLAEAQWVGEELSAVVLGVGINVATESIPPMDWDAGNPHPFPATCVEKAAEVAVDRLELLYAVLCALLSWKNQISGPAFLAAWEQNLALRGEWVQILAPGAETPPRTGQLLGLEQDGALRIREKSGEVVTLRVGEIRSTDDPGGELRLRSVDSSQN